MPHKTEEVVTADEAGARLDKWVKRRFPLSQGQLQKCLRDKDIRVNTTKAEANQRLVLGDAVSFSGKVSALSAKGDAAARDNAPLTPDAYIISNLKDMIVFEDEDMIVFNKPAGLAVQGGTGQRSHLDGWLKHLTNRKTGHAPRLVHRLDKATSGLLVTAKTPASAARLGEVFRSRELTKIYWAIVIGVPHPREGQVRSWVAKRTDNEGREMMEVVKHGAPNAKHAISDYVTLDQAGQRLSWVALRPLTGRTHQLRLHMQEMGTSILGDEKYETRRELPNGLGMGLHLHARALILPRKGKKPITLSAPIPKDFKTTMNQLGFMESSASKNPFE